jgi:hypothetical protein
MTKNPESLTFELKHLASELKRAEDSLKSEAAPDPLVLNEFRHAVDNIRLTVWSVSELINAQHTKKNPDTVLAFLAAERLRRFDQMVKTLSADIEKRMVTVQTNGMESLLGSVETLYLRLRQCFSEWRFKVKDAAS